MRENNNPGRKWIIIGWALGIAVAWATGGLIRGGIGGAIGGIVGGGIGGAITIMAASGYYSIRDDKQIDLVISIGGWVLGMGIYGALSRALGETLSRGFLSDTAWVFVFACSGAVGGILGSLVMSVFLWDPSRLSDIAVNALAWGIGFSLGGICGAILVPLIYPALIIFGYGIDPVLQGALSRLAGGAIAGGISGFVGEKYALRKLFRRSVEDSEDFPSA
jgi:hypothetical protein